MKIKDEFSGMVGSEVKRTQLKIEDQALTVHVLMCVNPASALSLGCLETKCPWKVSFREPHSHRPQQCDEHAEFKDHEW